MTDRRDFLKPSSLVGARGRPCPTFLGRTAARRPDAGKPGAKDTILVVVQLTGGNDGLNTVIPFKDRLYAKLRPTIKLPADQVKKINDDARPAPGAGRAGRAARGPGAVRRAGRRLPEPEPVALPLDGHLAGRPAPPRRSPRAGSARR